MAIDRGLLRSEPEAMRVPRRLVWSLLRLGRFDEAPAVAAALERPAADALSAWIARTAREVARLDAQTARATAATLPLLTPAESAALLVGLEPPEPRPLR